MIAAKQGNFVMASRDCAHSMASSAVVSALRSGRILMLIDDMLHFHCGGCAADVVVPNPLLNRTVPLDRPDRGRIWRHWIFFHLSGAQP